MTVLTVPDRTLSMYHVGLVVDDLEETATRYADLLGLRWARPRSMAIDVRVDGALRSTDLLVTYSMDGPPYVELIEERSGEIWAASALGLSHVGFWAPDLDGAADRLARAGRPARVHDTEADGRAGKFTYHEGDGGFWIELVDPSFANSLERWFARSVP